MEFASHSLIKFSHSTRCSLFIKSAVDDGTASSLWSLVVQLLGFKSFLLYSSCPSTQLTLWSTLSCGNTELFRWGVYNVMHVAALGTNCAVLWMYGVFDVNDLWKWFSMTFLYISTKVWFWNPIRDHVLYIKVCAQQGTHINVTCVKRKGNSRPNISWKLTCMSLAAVWLQRSHPMKVTLCTLLCLLIYDALLAGFVVVAVHCCQVWSVVCIPASWN